ncbi:MAG: helix-hairpin-helix domain-containing protein [Arsenophonus sp. NEOnobi-MAG3]
MYGIGFKTADQIAQNIGVDTQSLIRAQAGYPVIFYRNCLIRVIVQKNKGN